VLEKALVAGRSHVLLFLFEGQPLYKGFLSMMKIVTHQFDLGGRNVQLETGRVARQASGAVMVSDGLAQILCTVVVSARPILADFVPLSVHYVEKAYAGGKIPGGFLKREGKPADHEVLVSRLIDRAIRPTIPAHFHHEMQIICTVLSTDEGADLATLSILGASVALMRAGVPCSGPVAAVRLGYQTMGSEPLQSGADQLTQSNQGQAQSRTQDQNEDQAENQSGGQLGDQNQAPESAQGSLTHVQPAGQDQSQGQPGEQGQFCLGKKEALSGSLDLVMAGTAEGVVMVECAARQLPEATLVEALDYGQKALAPVFGQVHQFLDKAGPSAHVYQDADTLRQALLLRMHDLCDGPMKELCGQAQKQVRNPALEILRHDTCAGLVAEGMDAGLANAAFFKVWRHSVRQHILGTGKRVDNRGFEDIRAIDCQTRLLPRSSGSALFTRGDTQVIVSVVQGGKDDGQLVDGLDGMFRDNFMVHYNFPGFSVNELGRMAGPGRREIGHGKLAWRALRAVLPEGYTQTLRLVSEVTESCGSSSMATVCGGCLALFDAGVPLSAPVAGIAMGLVQEGDKMALLSDITGLEDAVGDMDFKVAGTPQGITALQMDLKGQPLTHKFMQNALNQARLGLNHILGVMGSQSDCLPASSPNPHGPTLTIVMIESDRVRELIGPGGKTVKELCETFGVRIEIGDTGRVMIFGATGQASARAGERIAQMMGTPKENVVYEGTVVSVLDFGAFVDIGFAQQGLVHISEIADRRIDNIHDVLNKGDRISVRVMGFDRGRAKLSIKQV
jgi:polyribonucleotide nucleotidyltransferase